MRAKDLLKLLKRYGCVQIRQKGSHIRIQCGKCFTTVPNHPGEDLGIGLLKQIGRDLAPCLGQGWLN
ncbi:MAG: type II toxin-antitoxin system HicA family toxin [Candidatus Obscuribacterales bacterium]|nr:type II toxin-antitoxin system HicA family toxin [Candidatus Obscuribacterales bacterium]